MEILVPRGFHSLPLSLTGPQADLDQTLSCAKETICKCRYFFGKCVENEVQVLVDVKVHRVPVLSVPCRQSV